MKQEKFDQLIRDIVALGHFEGDSKSVLLKKREDHRRAIYKVRIHVLNSMPEMSVTQKLAAHIVFECLDKLYRDKAALTWLGVR